MKLKTLKSEAIHHLMELEMLASTLRDRLEMGQVELTDTGNQADELISHAMSFTALVDRSETLEEAKGYIK